MADDPRMPVEIPAGASMEEAAALVSSWLMDNSHDVKGRIEFVRFLDEFIADYAFTLGAVKVLAPGLPDRGGV